jgi:hypothetical protein
MAKAIYHVIQCRQYFFGRVRHEHQVRMRWVFPRLGIKHHVALIYRPASHVPGNCEHHGHELELFAALTLGAEAFFLKVCPTFPVLPNIVPNGTQSSRNLGFPSGGGVFWRADETPQGRVVNAAFGLFVMARYHTSPSATWSGTALGRHRKRPKALFLFSLWRIKPFKSHSKILPIDR